MQVRINGQSHELAGPMTVAGLLEFLGYRDVSLAVAINANCIPRRQFADYKVDESDEIEILAPMAGG
ncbi:MAG: sulfur carrier protein ThiS [Proteobacteria bacterium]|nr:sulfur carrier protein ThiS [Pseudomonadota bacterium]